MKNHEGECDGAYDDCEDCEDLILPRGEDGPEAYMSEEEFLAAIEPGKSQ
jgi:hypothetical protein